MDLHESISEVLHKRFKSNPSIELSRGSNSLGSGLHGDDGLVKSISSALP